MALEDISVLNIPIRRAPLTTTTESKPKFTKADIDDLVYLMARYTRKHLAVPVSLDAKVGQIIEADHNLFLYYHKRILRFPTIIKGLRETAEEATDDYSKDAPKAGSPSVKPGFIEPKDVISPCEVMYR